MTEPLVADPPAPPDGVTPARPARARLRTLGRVVAAAAAGVVLEGAFPPVGLVVPRPARGRRADPARPRRPAPARRRCSAWSSASASSSRTLQWSGDLRRQAALVRARRASSPPTSPRMARAAALRLAAPRRRRGPRARRRRPLGAPGGGPRPRGRSAASPGAASRSRRPTSPAAGLAALGGAPLVTVRRRGARGRAARLGRRRARWPRWRRAGGRAGGRGRRPRRWLAAAAPSPPLGLAVPPPTAGERRSAWPPSRATCPGRAWTSTPSAAPSSTTTSTRPSTLADRVAAGRRRSRTSSSGRRTPATSTRCRNADAGRGDRRRPSTRSASRSLVGAVLRRARPARCPTPRSCGTARRPGPGERYVKQHPVPVRRVHPLPRRSSGIFSDRSTSCRATSRRATEPACSTCRCRPRRRSATSSASRSPTTAWCASAVATAARSCSSSRPTTRRSATRTRACSSWRCPGCARSRPAGPCVHVSTVGVSAVDRARRHGGAPIGHFTAGGARGRRAAARRR